MKRTFLIIILGCGALILLLALNASQRRTAAAELALTEETLAAVAQTASELETLTLSLDKLRVTTSLRQTAALLHQCALSADRVQQALAELPDAQNQRSTILAYLSRLSALTRSCLADLAESAEMAEDSRASLIGMAGGLRLLLAEMALAQQDLLQGTKIAALPATDLSAPPTAQELAKYKALPSKEISAGEAMQIAKEFVGLQRVTSVAHAPDTSGALPAYGVTVQTPDVQLNLEVTRRGGKVLLMVPETASFSNLKSVEECTAAAMEFLKNRGFAAMETPYYQVYDGLCVLTCVYAQNGVLVWPDRVLVQVRMDTAEVVGLEARSYWQNHIPRRMQSPLLTEAEARSAISSEVTVENARLCLLPHDGQERLCWQFTVRQEEEQFIVFIDAMNGSELLLEKLMQLEQGQVPA